MYLVLVRARDVHKVVRGFRRYGGRGGCRSRRRVLLFFALCVHCGPRLARGVPARPDRACGMLPAQARACVLQVEDAQKHPPASWLKYGLYMLAGLVSLCCILVDGRCIVFARGKNQRAPVRVLSSTWCENKAESSHSVAPSARSVCTCAHADACAAHMLTSSALWLSSSLLETCSLPKACSLPMAG